MRAITTERYDAPMQQLALRPQPIRLRFSKADEVLPGLDAAVQSLIAAANLERRCGILIVRHGPGDYTAALDESVAFGETMTRILG